MNLWLIALMLIGGAGGLGWLAWRLSVWAWAHRPVEDVAPRTHLPSLHELQSRRDRR